MEDSVVQSLEELGLSEKEAKVYMAALALGPSPVQKIADAAGIKRVTTYVILESLTNLGLASQSTRGKKTYFVAEDPISLRRLVKKKEQELDDQKQNLENILPALTKLKSRPKEVPQVQFYDSVEGIRSIMASFIELRKQKDVKKLYGISNLDQLYSFFPDMEGGANPERMKSGLASEFIYTYSGGPTLKDSDKQSKRISRFVPPDVFSINGDISILGDSVAILALGGQRPVGITIKSAEISKAMKALFDLAWEAAAKFNQ